VSEALGREARKAESRNRGKFLAETQRTRTEENTKHMDGNVDARGSRLGGVANVG
jgi:hypothetical protein